MCLSFLIRDKAEALSKHPHVLPSSLSDVLDSCPVRGFKSFSADGSSICLAKTGETIGLTLKDRNPS